MSSLQYPTSLASGANLSTFMPNNTMAAQSHTSHPNFGHLVLLVFEAVLEVVCVSLPGYIVARQGMFDASAQKFVANLNVQLFTPCLVFTKLASQLNTDNFVELAVIPVIFVAQTLVSWLCAVVVSKIYGFPKRQTNFVIAMGVFGNSNSLPISLVISLSKTLKGLHWDRIPGDNDNDVGARGILYLLIFQQLGQLLRWSWGYNVLLKPPAEPSQSPAIEEGLYRDSSDDDLLRRHNEAVYNSDYESGQQTPHAMSDSGSSTTLSQGSEPIVAPLNGNMVKSGPGNLAGHESSHKSTPSQTRFPSTTHITQFPTYISRNDEHSTDASSADDNILQRIRSTILKSYRQTTAIISTSSTSLFNRLPIPAQKVLRVVGSGILRFLLGVYGSMNPPLWAMLAAVIVATVPQLQHAFFDRGTFLNNSVTHAITQSAGVAVPLILVVLGANLARNTIPQDELAVSPEDKKEEKKLLIAALISRMLLPTIIMAPALALFAKFVPVSILDDPIFIIVCFLLTGAPSALQLAQICQLHNVFMGVMSKLLFQSYVIWILPSTLILVLMALETVEWATATS